MRKIVALLWFILIAPLSYGQSLSWAKGFGRGNIVTGLPSIFANAMARDAVGNIYTTGAFTSTAAGIDFDPGPGVFNLISGGGTDVFVSKLDPNGNFIWAKSMGGLNTQVGQQITLDPLGNIYIAGYFRGTPDFNPGVGVFTITTSGNDDTFIAKLDPSGNFIWAKNIGGSGAGDDRMINAIATDGVGNIYFTGQLVGGGQSFDLDPNAGTFLLTLPVTAFSNAYVAKWDMNGNFVWANQLVQPVGLSSTGGNDIKLDAFGNVFIVGNFGDVADFDPGAGVFNMGVMGTTHAFLWVLTNAGIFIGAKEFGGTVLNSSTVAMSLNFDAGNNIYITGIFAGSADFDPNAGVFNLSSPSVNFQSLFVVKLSPLAMLLWAKAVSTTTGFIDGIYRGLGTVGPCGITISGTFFGTADFDPNAGVFNISATAFNLYILQLDPNGNFVYALQSTFVFNSPLLIDGLGNMYGTGVFSGTIDFDLNPNATFNLTASGVGGSTFVVKLLPSPWAPNVISPVSACLNASDTLFASTISGSTLSWFSAPTGGAFLGSGNSYITPVLTDTTVFYVQDSTCQAGPRNSITVTTFSCAPLPITLLSFDATNIQNKEVLTEWTTSAEINNDYFTIERSSDAIHFEPIGTKQGAGNSNTPQYYLFMDINPLPKGGAGWVYYRLKQTDFDGNFEYFDVKAVTFNKITSEEEIAIYPNPTTGEFFITYNNVDANKVTIGLTDAVGKKIRVEVEGNSKKQKVLLPMELPNGMYFLNITTENQFIVKKIIKK